MKYDEQRDALLKEEEAYINNLYPTKQPMSSKEIKRQLNNSFRSVYSNISKNTNFFQDSNIFLQTNQKNINKTNNLDILPDINYTNEIINMKQNDNNIKENNNNNNMINPKSSNIDLNYCFGVLSNNIKNIFCFHWTEKFFIYLSKNIIIVEDFSIEKNRTQKLITDSEYELEGIKLSFNNKLLLVWTNLTLLKCNPFIIFYQYENYYPKFTLLNKLSFDKGNIINCEFSPDNNLVLIISKFNQLYFISIFSFIENKITVTTFLKEEIIKVEFNKYLTSLEFCTLGKNLITLWRINPFEQKLEYQNINLKLKNNMQENNYEFTSINYLKTNFNNDMILLLIGCSNSNIICIDSKTNNELYIFNNINNNKPIDEIITNNDMLCFLSDNKIKYCNNIMSINKQNINIEKYFNCMIFSESFFDSGIQSFNYNYMQGFDLILLTNKSMLYYYNLLENISVKLYSFNQKENSIINIKIIKKKYSTQKNNSNEDDIYYIISWHRNNEIKIWAIPDFNLIYNFETINENIKCIDTALDELFFVVSYDTNNIRFFNNEKFLGKFNSENLGSYSPIMLIKILPDWKYIYLIDETNIIYLIFLEQIEPLIIQFHIIAKISYPIKDFNISNIDSYNLFYINIQNLYINIYNRKYANIIKNNNNNFSKNTPEFYIKDKINLIDCFMGHKNDNNNLIINFSLDIKQKNLIFILSKRNKMILIRNFENHTNLKNILFVEDILDFSLSNNNYYIFFLFNNKIQKTAMSNILIENFEYVNTEELCERESDLIGLKSGEYQLRICNDNLLMTIFSKDSMFIYKI